MINTNAATPEKSGLPLGDISRVTKVSGSGRKRVVWRVQYADMYFCYPTAAIAKAKRDSKLGIPA